MNIAIRCFFFIALISYIVTASDDSMTNVFQSIKINELDISEDRFLVKFQKPVFNDSLKFSIKNCFELISDSIQRFEFLKNEIDFKGIPKSFWRGFCGYRIKGLFSQSFYTTKFISDSSGMYLCIWSFKTSEGGTYLKGSKCMTKKILKELKKKFSDIKIVSVFKK